MSFDQMIASIRKKLPIQNPLHSFVHNNILQMFEDKDFHDAVAEAGTLYRARAYWPIYKYTEKFQEKKITEPDIMRAIDHYMGSYQAIPSLEMLGITPKEYFYRLMFSELAFNDDETQPNLSNKNLWDHCNEKMLGQKLVLSRSKVIWRGKEYWEKYHNESYALSVQPLIIRLISSYLDQGQSFWANPFVTKGFWDFFVFDLSTQKGFLTGWQNDLLQKIENYKVATPEEVITKELTKKGIPETEWESYLLELLFDLKGWSGMVNKLEQEPWQATVKSPNLKLVDYIAALVLIESAMDSYHSHFHSLDLTLIHGRQEKVELGGYQLALALYQMTQSFKLPERWMRDFSAEDLLRLINEVDQSEFRDNIRLWHEAYEHHFHREAIEALALHAESKRPTDKAYAQLLFCIDDREESIRRHVEEIDHNLETFGVVGFFNIDMKFSSHKNKRLVAQCPPVVTPSRIIREIPKNNAESFKKRNSFLGSSDLSLYYNSRTLFRGFFSTLILGFASLVPMFVQVFFPNHSKFLKKRLQSFVTSEPETEMSIEQDAEGFGYSKLEMAKIVEGVLKMCGITTSRMSDLVVLMGHGASSNNNPFKQAYGCGACGGNAGIPNSRAFAKMGNDPEVRKELKNLGLEIPDSTFLVSGYHDTTTDEVHFFNVEDIPQNLRSNFDKVRASLKEATKLNAFERCQRFTSFNDSTPEDALRHVNERAHDLAQPRPEYGHSTNALAVVGRRELTKGLFMNRRSFLLSYDWKTDPDGSILRQVVLGGVPVCVNINMDYYFSCVDNENFGCGSKLPLNLTSLLGVMTGSQSDLRIGLARQMVEIHEPIRNLTLIEAPLEKVRSLFGSHPRLKNILYQHWMRLAVLDPETNKWWMFTHKDFEEINFEHFKLDHYRSSFDFVSRTHADHDFAEIDS